MHYNTNQQRREKILEFVNKNPGTIKRKVIEFMSSKEAKKISSVMTTHMLLNEIISSGKIKVEATHGARDHHLFINNRDHFFVLKSEIDRYQRFANNFRKEIMKENNFKRFKEDKYFRDFIRLTQLEFFRKISWISVKIQSYIKSAEDRQILNLHLSRILLDSNRLNGILTNPNEIIDLLNESKIKYSRNDNIMHLFFKNLPHINEV